MLVELAAELIPVADVRPLPSAPTPNPVRIAALVASVKEHGVLEPLLVRPASNSWILQEARRHGVWGWMLIDTRRVDGRAYRGEPAFYLTRKAAQDAKPADVPFEVVRGLGRLAAAKAARLRLVPCVIQELTDEEVAVLRACLDVCREPMQPSQVSRQSGVLEEVAMAENGAVEAFWETVNRAYGAFLDATKGFYLVQEKIVRVQDYLTRTARLPKKTLDSSEFIFGGVEDPNSPTVETLHVVTQGELKHRNRQDGENTLFMGAMCLVAIYQFWEDRFRTEIAAELELGREELTHDVFGDIRMIRIGIVHHGGIAKTQIEKCKLFKWFKAGDVIEIDENRMKELVFALRDVCEQWRATRDAHLVPAP